MFASCGSLEDARGAFDKIKRPNVFSWNIMLAAYVQKRCLRDARQIFDAMEKRDVVSWTTLLSGYAQMGYVDEARGIFDKMKKQSDVSWSSMISAYAQNGHPAEALKLFQVMSLEGVKARTSCLVSVVDSCGNALDTKVGKVLHQAVQGLGLEGDVVVGTALVDMLGKFGKPEEAFQVFENIPQRNTVSWNAIMSAFAQNSRSQGALFVFRTMCFEGVKQDSVTFLNLFGVCSKVSALAVDGECWYNRLLEAGFVLDCSLETAVVNLFASCGKLEQAFSVFNGMRQRSVVTWTIVIRACGEAGDAKTALAMLSLMDQDGVHPDKVVILSVLEACSSDASFSSSTERVRSLHRDVVGGTGFHSDPKVGTALVMLYSKSGSLDDAKTSFDGIHGSGTVASWTAMIVAYIQSGQSHKSLQLFQRMDLEGIQPDSVTFGYVLKVCADAGAREQGRAIHSAIEEAGIVTTGGVAIALIEMYERCGSLTESFKLFTEMVPELPLQRLVAGLHRQKVDDNEMEDFFRTFALEGESMDREAAIAVISACWQSSIARTIHSRVVDSDLIGDCDRRDSNLAAAIINMHGKCGNLREARGVFDELHGFRDSVVWTSMMAAYSRDSGAKSCGEIFELFAVMCLEGVVPSSVSFIVVLTACSHSGMLGRAVDIVGWMTGDFGMEVSGYHLACVLDLLGRNNGHFLKN